MEGYYVRTNSQGIRDAESLRNLAGECSITQQRHFTINLVTISVHSKITIVNLI